MRLHLPVALLLSVAMFPICPALAGGLPKDQIPADAKWVIHLDVQGFLASQTGKTIMDQAGPMLKMASAALEMTIGIDPLKDISSVTFYGTAYDDHSIAAIVDVQMDRDKVLTALKTGAGFKESLKYGDYTIYEWQEVTHTAFIPPEGNSPAPSRPAPIQATTVGYLAFHGKNLAVASQNLGMLKQALDVLDGKGKTIAVDKEFPEIPEGTFVTAYARDAHLLRIQHTLNDTNTGFMTPGLYCRAANLFIGEKDDKFFVRVAVTANDEHLAVDLQKIAEGALALGDLACWQVASSTRLNLAKPVVADVQATIAGDKVSNVKASTTQATTRPAELLLDSLQSVIVSREGKTVRVNADIPMKNSLELIRYLTLDLRQSPQGHGSFTIGVNPVSEAREPSAKSDPGAATAPGTKEK